jgi:chromosome segregation ATPase
MIKSLQTENAKFKHESRLSNTKFGTQAAESAKLEVSLQGANALAAKYRDQITTLETQNRELRDNLYGAAAGHTAEVAELAMKNTQIKTELQNMTKRATTLEEKIDNLQVDKQNFMAESQTRGCKNDQLVAEVHSIREQLLTLHIENTRLQRDNKQILSKNVEVQAELQHAQAHNIEVQQDIELSSRGAVMETNGENRYLSMSIGERKLKFLIIRSICDPDRHGAVCLFAKRLEDESSKCTSDAARLGLG